MNSLKEPIQRTSNHSNLKKPAKHSRLNRSAIQRYAARKQAARVVPKKTTNSKRIRPVQHVPVAKNSLSPFHWQWTHHYLMTGFALLMSCFGVLMCGLDLVLGWPLYRASLLFDVVFFICSGIMLALSWSVYKDLPKIARNGNWHRCEGMQRGADRFNVGV